MAPRGDLRVMADRSVPRLSLAKGGPTCSRRRAFSAPSCVMSLRVASRRPAEVVHAHSLVGDGRRVPAFPPSADAAATSNTSVTPLKGTRLRRGSNSSWATSMRFSCPLEISTVVGWVAPPMFV